MAFSSITGAITTATQAPRNLAKTIGHQVTETLDHVARSHSAGTRVRQPVDKVSIGSRPVDTDLHKAGELRRRSLRQKPSSKTSAGRSANTQPRKAATSRVRAEAPAAAGSCTPTPTNRATHVEAPQVCAKQNQYELGLMVRKGFDRLNLPDVKKSRVQKPHPVKIAHTPTTDIKPEGFSLFKNWRLEKMGLAGGLFQMSQGVGKVADGRVGEGSLQVGAGALETADNLHRIKQAKNGANVGKIVSEGVETTAKSAGSRGVAKFLGPAAAVTFAAVDGVAAKNAFENGNEVEGTERAMDSMWSLSGAVPVAAPGALAHSLTRLAMSTEVAGVSGDKLATNGIDWAVNGKQNSYARGQDSYNARALSALRQVARDDHLKIAALNRNKFSQAITGLLEEISSEKDPIKRSRLENQLKYVRKIQRNVRGFQNQSSMRRNRLDALDTTRY